MVWMGVPQACHEVVKKVSRKEMGGWKITSRSTI